MCALYSKWFICRPLTALKSNIYLLFLRCIVLQIVEKKKIEKQIQKGSTVSITLNS